MGMLHQDKRSNISPPIHWNINTHWQTWGYKHPQQYASLLECNSSEEFIQATEYFHFWKGFIQISEPLDN